MKLMRLFVVLVLVLMILSLSGCVEPVVEDTVVEETVVEEPVQEAVVDEVEDVVEDVYILTEDELDLDILPPLFGHIGDKKLVKWSMDPDLDVLGLDSLETTYTSVRYGFESVPDSELETSGYPFETEIYSGELPADYQYTIEYDDIGTMYLRAYAVVNGQEYWTEEKSVYIRDGQEE